VYASSCGQLSFVTKYYQMELDLQWHLRGNWFESQSWVFLIWSRLGQYLLIFH